MISPSESDRISLDEDPGSEQPAGNSHQKNFWRGKNGFEKFSSPKKFLRDSAQPSLSQHQASIPLPFLICISDLPHHNKNNLGKGAERCSAAWSPRSEGVVHQSRKATATEALGSWLYSIYSQEVKITGTGIFWRRWLSRGSWRPSPTRRHLAAE